MPPALLVVRFSGSSVPTTSRTAGRLKWSSKEAQRVGVGWPFSRRLRDPTAYPHCRAPQDHPLQQHHPELAPSTTCGRDTREQLPTALLAQGPSPLPWPALSETPEALQTRRARNLRHSSRPVCKTLPRHKDPLHAHASRKTRRPLSAPAPCKSPVSADGMRKIHSPSIATRPCIVLPPALPLPSHSRFLRSDARRHPSAPTARIHVTTPVASATPYSPPVSCCALAAGHRSLLLSGSPLSAACSRRCPTLATFPTLHTRRARTLLLRTNWVFVDVGRTRRGVGRAVVKHVLHGARSRRRRCHDPISTDLRHMNTLTGRPDNIRRPLRNSSRSCYRGRELARFPSAAGMSPSRQCIHASPARDLVIKRIGRSRHASSCKVAAARLSSANLNLKAAYLYVPRTSEALGSTSRHATLAQSGRIGLRVCVASFKTHAGPTRPPSAYRVHRASHFFPIPPQTAPIQSLPDDHQVPGARSGGRRRFCQKTAPTRSLPDVHQVPGPPSSGRRRFRQKPRVDLASHKQPVPRAPLTPCTTSRSHKIAAVNAAVDIFGGMPTLREEDAHYRPLARFHLSLPARRSRELCRGRGARAHGRELLLPGSLAGGTGCALSHGDEAREDHGADGSASADDKAYEDADAESQMMTHRVEHLAMRVSRGVHGRRCSRCSTRLGAVEDITAVNGLQCEGLAG
ncbi:hypothetical protein GGX14DRAFT_607260 [Mycena pura]|uniref:Uncharacterized protein n=1 Tax=Mycena pura TaxID=153505 RepID=A0AAD6VM00_9AGAR|nr:hypothetical protein GGX14DRAFT_607260 [Mycena pura]